MISQFNTASPSRKASLTHAKRYVRHITSLFHHYTSFCCLLFGMLLFFSCGKSSSSDSIPTPTPVAKSTAKVVSSFVFEASENTALDSDVTATVTGTAIAATVPLGTDVTALTPTIVVSDKAIIAPNTGVETDFTSDVKYIVTAEDKSTQAYTVTVTIALSPAKEVTKFTFETADNTLTDAVIGDITDTAITATVPLGTDVTKLIPTIMHTGASIAPLTGVAQDFTSDVKYIVTAEDKSTQAYTVTVTVASSSSTDITSFIFKEAGNDALNTDVTAVVDATAKTITATVPLGTDVTKLIPTITHTGASIAPNTGVATDFTSPATYTVTAADGTTQVYTVTVTAKAYVGKYVTIPDPNFRKYLKEKFPAAFGTRETMDANHANVIDFAETIDVSEKEISSLEGIQYFTKLTKLQCYKNQLTALDVSKNTALTTLYCYENQLKKLDVSKNIGLIDFWCNQNKLTVLDVSKNTALTTLSCFTNQLTELDVRQHTDLTTLYCNDNPLGTLDVTKNIKLEELRCKNNQLKVLDVTQNINLEQLRCDKNELTELDVTKNTALTYLSCEETKLTSLDVTQNTALITLSCNRAELTDLDVSKNLVLEVLYCWNNPLGTLDVSKNLALKELDCENNQLMSLDVSQNTKLTYLSCIYNILTTLDMTGMQSVDDSAAPEYPGLNFKVGEVKEYQGDMVTTNPLTTLKVNVALQDREEMKQVKTTRGTDVVISTHKTDGTVVCADYNPNTNVCATSINEISSFVFEADENTALTTDITATILGTDINIVVPIGTNVTQLKPTIVVSDKASINPASGTTNDFTSPVKYTVTAENTSTQDYTVTVTIAVPYVTIPDANFRKYLKEEFPAAFGSRETMDANHADITSFTGTIDVNYKKIASLEGVQYFTKLTVLDCSENELTSLDVSKNIKLTKLNCGGNISYLNKLTNLDVSKNIELTDLNCSYNQLTELDVSKNIELIDLNCHSNKLISLDVSENIRLTKLDCGGGNRNHSNRLTTLDVRKNTALTYLNCSYNQLTALDVSENIRLTKLYCGGDSILFNKLTELDVSKNIALTNLDCSANQFKELDISNNIALIVLDCAQNSLKELDVSKNIKLTRLYCYTNKLGILDLSKNATLEKLRCDYNDLISLDLSKNTALTYLVCLSNNLKVLDVSQNTALTELDCRFNKLTALDLTGMQSVEQLLIDAGEEYNGIIKNLLTTLKVNELIKQEDAIKDTKTNRGTDVVISTHNTDGTVVCKNYDPNTGICASTAEISSFVFEANKNQGISKDLAATISGTDINIVVSSPTLTALTPTIIVPDKASIAPLTGVVQDFSKPVTYTVTAENGDKKTYTIRVANYATIPDANFRRYLKEKFPAAFGSRETMDINHPDITSFAGTIGVNREKIASLEGIQYFTKLTVLDCAQNSLKELDVSKNIKLRNLYCSYNDLKSLDVSQNTALTDLRCGGGTSNNNDLTELDVRPLTKLIRLDCSYNDLTSLDVSQNIALTDLNCGGGYYNNNDLTELDVRPLTKLTNLNCRYNNLKVLNVSQNTTLTDLDCADNNLTSLNVLPLTKLTYLDCGSNDLTSLNVRPLTKLNRLNCSYNDLKSLDVSQNTTLIDLYCGGNDLTSLNVLPLTKLTRLYCQYNDLTSLNVLPLTKLTSLNCRGNDLTSLDVSQQPALRLLRCNSNKLTTLILGQKPKLEVLECESNDLTSLDIREIQSVPVRFFKIDAGEEDNGVTKNPLTMLRVNEMLKNYQEIKDAKTNRGSAITITTYNTDGTVGCTNYDPNTGTCQN